jgi:hypothetical protein
MPYIPPHLRPGYVTTYVAPPVKTGARFPTNVDYSVTTNVKNNGTRHVPRHGPAGKKTLKHVRTITPNSAPPYKPSHSVKEWPGKFRDYVMRQITTKTKKTTRRKTRAKKKCPKGRKCTKRTKRTKRTK